VSSASLLLAALLVVSRAAAAAGPPPAPAETALVSDDFEGASPWTFSASRGAGSPSLNTHLAQGGASCLECVTTGNAFTLSRRLELVERGSRLCFWFRPVYDATTLTDVVLTVTVDSATDGQSYSIRIRDPAPNEWHAFDTDVGRVSPGLVGDALTGIHLRLSARSGPLRLALDDFSVTQESRSEPALVEPPLRPRDCLAYKQPRKCSPVLQWALSGRLRAFPTSTADTLGAAAAAGFNAALVPAQAEDELIALISAAHDHGLAAPVCFPVFHVGLEWGKDREGTAAGFAGAVCPDVVCPFDWNNWDTLVRLRLQRLVALSQVLPLDGILLDLHLHGGLQPALANTDACLCAHCVDSYLRSRDVTELGLETTPEKRYAKLCRDGRLRDYYDFLRRRLERRVRDLINDNVPAATPLMIGVLDYEPHWTGDALATGVFAARGEVLVLARAGCQSGYSWETDRLVDRIRALGDTAVCVPGIAPSQVGTDRLPLELFHAAMNSAGYWLSMGREVVEGDFSQQRALAASPELLRRCQPINQEIAEWTKRSG